METNTVYWKTVSNCLLVLLWKLDWDVKRKSVIIPSATLKRPVNVYQTARRNIPEHFHFHYVAVRTSQRPHSPVTCFIFPYYVDFIPGITSTNTFIRTHSENGWINNSTEHRSVISSYDQFVASLFSAQALAKKLSCFVKKNKCSLKKSRTVTHKAKELLTGLRWREKFYRKGGGGVVVVE